MADGEDQEVLVEDDAPICSDGWSISLRELRAAIKGLPDEWEVVLDAADVEDCEIAALHVHGRHGPTDQTCGLLVLSAGQVISSEYDYHRRLDASFEDPSHPRWDEETASWQPPRGD